MSGSPIGSVGFTALGRGWTLKFGHRQRFRVEGEFGMGFAGAVLKCFPGVTPELIAADDARGIAAAMQPSDVMIGSIAMLFACGVLEPASDDDIDGIVDELGFQRLCELLGEAFTAASPPSRETRQEGAPGASTGEARKGKPARR